ncbi:cob(I)yrinic acid a,c-diamide adenosyltransferase [Mesoterricola silvestris]|uniref:Corrinoid adenosyltransferase n=1 Tax=Mesoterricola silvestris TaxID=2927979 RepID=A0AA48GNF3_9BACT|nr:cob(I)yrinic acid a,c-diamide adenosyltransferase [Mesoterricola silvestris]BDU74622.1 ATP--cob(I)alamin adenosyltransferase [Mesoterricola silvestris]
MKIYTRTGDEGVSGLFGGERVPKDHLRLAAYGTLDELNSLLGVLGLHLPADLAGPLEAVQHDLFSLGAILATPPSCASLLDQRMTRQTWSIAAMEADIDRLTALAPPMTAFVLPGGCPASAYAHWARTVCRRAERDVVTLGAQEEVHPDVLVYLNRLSDWLFSLARAANALAGVPDVKWVPKG